MPTVNATAAIKIKPGETIVWGVIISLVAVLLLTAGCARSAREKTQKTAGDGTAPVVHRPDTSLAQADEAEMAPGLSVVYIFKKLRHIDEMPRGNEILEEGKPGKPVLFLDHHFGKGEIFDSGKKQAVGVQMSGFIRFSRSGRYGIQANSNDGIRIFVAGRMIVDDPKVHAERLTVPGIVIIDKPGWYPVWIQYFQRKGKATLQLFWQEPGSDRYRILPAVAYAHLPRIK